MDWISVKERLPKREGFFLTYGKGGIGKMFVSRFCWSPYYADAGMKFPANVTHWMPLPEPPVQNQAQQETNSKTATVANEGE